MQLTNQTKFIHLLQELLVSYFLHSVGRTITRSSNDLHSINTAQKMKFSIKDFFSTDFCAVHFPFSISSNPRYLIRDKNHFPKR